MLKTLLLPLTLQLLLLSSPDSFVSPVQAVLPNFQSGTLQKMIVTQGSVTLELDVNRLNGLRSRSQTSKLRFGLATDSFFTILVYNDVLRGPLPGTMALAPQNLNVSLPAGLNAVANQLVLEKTDWNNSFEWVIRDSTSGFVYFNIEGINDDYDSKAQVLSLKDGRLLVSKEFAAKLGRPSEERSVVGTLSFSATMRAIEVTQVVNGEVRSSILPPISPGSEAPAQVSGPDVIVGDLPSLVQSGSSGTQVGLAVATTSCNLGTVELDWFQLPNNDHPVIPQNLYRLSGGTNNDDRFEQIGQSWLKHAFNALQESFCSTCAPAANGTHLGAGCSDPYTTSLNGSQSSLGSRAWVNPFTGFFPGSSPNPDDHTGHIHTGTSHRILVDVADLDTTLNGGATYYAEAQYVTPHEYTWCQSHPGQCNMYNNASYRRFNVSGTSSFTFSPVGATQQTRPAITAWPGASNVTIEPAPGIDGTGIVASKVTNPSPGVWHFEYAVYNQNLDRGIQSFSVPLPAGITISNIGFHAPPQPAAFANDGTAGGAGFSSAPWTATQAADSLTWSSETFATNENANAIRWGTLYNFRFDADRPPQNLNATVGFFKTGSPISAQVQGPAATTISINDVAVVEGNSGTSLATFAVTLSAASSQTITVQYATADNVASAGSDYVSTSGTLTFAPGQTSQPVSVTIHGDTTFEPNETFSVNLTSPVNAAIGDAQGVGTILDDDSIPSISINDVSLVEGNSGAKLATFDVTLSNASSQTITVNYATAPVTATPGADYLATSGTLTFISNQTSQTISVTVNGDVLNEANETFNLNLSSPSNATINDGTGVGTIVDDDPPPSLSINDVSVAEGDSGTVTATFTVTLSAVSGQTVAVNYATGNDTATAGVDYVATSGTLSFTAGQTTQTIAVTVNGDSSVEPNETFFVNLSSPTNVTFSDNQGVGTILNDDVQPALSIGDVTVTEGDSGTVNANFVVTLSPASLQTVTVKYATANGTASSGSDYQSTSGTLTFTPGQTSQPVTVVVNGDTLNEANETFFINLSNATIASITDSQAIGTITNDDPLPSLSVDDVSVIEGNGGTAAAVFTASLSAVSGQTVTVNFSTADGTASSGSDYIPLIGTLTFGPGFTSKTFIISVKGDTTIEPDETFFVNLSGATNAAIADAQGQGTIVNDDLPAPAFEFTQANFDNPEGRSSLLVTVRRTGNPAPAAAVDFQTNDNTNFVECNAVTGIANQRCDYLSTNGTLSFGPNEVEKSFPVIVYNDLYPEGNETIALSLINPSTGTSLGPQNTATITILDDDSGTPVTNPIDGSRFFVEQHYFDFLQRTPDQAGEDFWVSTIDSCGADSLCINNKRITVSDAFFFEPEYQQTAAYVVRLYRIAFGNNQPFPNPAADDLVEAKKLIDYSVFLRDRARVVGGPSLDQSQLNLANAFVQRPEFLTKYPASLTGPQFVDALLASIHNDLGVDMNSQRTALINLFNSGGRGTVMFRLSDDDAGGNPINNRALIDAEYNRTFVFTEYVGYLRRNSDLNGFKFWLGQVNSFPVRNLGIQHAMVCSFITSQEYQQRFSSVVTRTNASCQ